MELPAGVQPIEPGPYFFGIASNYALGLLALLWGTTLGFLITARFRPRIESMLPDARRLEDVTYRTVIVGWPLLGVGIVLGGVWANEAWGPTPPRRSSTSAASSSSSAAGFAFYTAHKRIWARITSAGVEMGAAHRNADAFRLEFESICAAVGLQGGQQAEALAA